MSSANCVTNFTFMLSRCPLDKTGMLLNQMVDAFCGQNIPPYEDYSQIWSLQEWWDVISYGKGFFGYAVNNSEDVKEIKSLSPEYQVIVSDCLKVRAEDLREALVEKTHAISAAYLKDFDWRLKLTLSSDKLASVREPMLALDFDIQEDNGRKLLSLDMSKEEVKRLIDCLEESNKAISQLKP